MVIVCGNRLCVFHFRVIIGMFIVADSLPPQEDEKDQNGPSFPCHFSLVSWILCARVSSFDVINYLGMVSQANLGCIRIVGVQPDAS